MRHLILACICASVFAALCQGQELTINVWDPGHSACVNAQVQLKQGDKVIASAQTDASGHALLPSPPAGHYEITADLAGFETARSAIDVPTPSQSTTVDLTLSEPAVHKESVQVEGTAPVIDQGSSTAKTIPADAAEQLPNRPATVADTLPLIPGVVRSPEGGLRISGAAENRSALLVNSADVTDPATGQFGLTVPIDSVQTMSVYQASYLAEYGRFTGGLVSVETKRGGDDWKWDLNDPFPDFRIRSRHLEGVKDATPRLNFGGPIIPGKLYFSEGFEYVFRDAEAYTLTYPNNQTRTEGFNSFSQLDWVISDKNLVTGTLQVAPQRQNYVGINFLNPEPVSPNDGIHDYVATVADRLTLGGGLLENTLSATRFDANIWPQGDLGELVAPWGNSGNYFEQQSRTASRLGLTSTYSFAEVKALGTHSFKAGSYLAGSIDTGQVHDRRLELVDGSGNLAETISFTAGRPYGVTDTEYAFFGQDHWTISPHLAIDAGLRGESQEISQSFRLAPRIGLAWSPIPAWGTVLRGGFGLFYDQVPLNIYAFSSYPSQVLTYYDPAGNIIGGPITMLNLLGQVTTPNPFVVRSQRPGNFSPQSATGSIELEQPLGKNIKLRATYLQNDSSGLVLLNPVTPPNSSTGYDVLTGTGKSNYRQFEVTSSFRIVGPNPVFVSYVRSLSQGDLNDFSGYLGSFPTPIIRPDQYANLPADLPNRLLAWGNLKLPRGWWVTPIFEYRNGFPYIVTDALQQYVGTPNELRFPHFFSLDSRFSKDIKVTPKYAVRLSLSMFNITDHFNPEGLHTNIADPDYGGYLGQHGRRYTVDFDVLF